MTTAHQARPGIRTLGLLAAGAILLTGCASSHSGSDAPAKSPVTSGAMTPGMVMPDGSTMGAAAAPSDSAGAKPSASALVICSDEIRSDLQTVLAVKTIPAGTATFVNGLYTCRYALSMGPLVLSVQETPNTAATTAYFQALRTRLGKTAAVTDLAGLGEAAYGTNDGTVVLRKDHDVLRVDATKLPAQFGSQHAKRADFAYEIASDVLGCWTGDDGS